VEEKYNTLKARNIFVNNTAASMNAARWYTILTLTGTGIQAAGKAQRLFKSVFCYHFLVEKTILKKI